jgi:two-component system, NtrC family, response regulator HydG
MGDSYSDSLDRAKLAPLLEHMSDGVFVVDSDRRICLFNHAAQEISGLSAEQATGRICHNVFTGLDEGADCAIFPRPACTIRSAFETGESCGRQEAEVTFPNGSRKSLACDVVPLLGGDGAVAFVAVVLQDVSELHALRQELEERYEFQSIIAKNHRMQEIFSLIEQIADTDANVLIEGESGTGKELVARAIHHRSRRDGKPFVQVNCSALVETLLESELFGHARGAFTGAVRDKIGRFEAADGGTIFLDEIGDISPAVQVKLLRVIQERRFERVGENTSRTADVRIVTATNRNLKDLMQSGVFREDLYYRLRVVPVSLPPLRERREDIPLLVEHFIERFRERMDRPIRTVSASALAMMMDHAWPGNVRELENAVEHAFVRCAGTEIRPEDLPAELRMGPLTEPAAAPGAAPPRPQMLRPSKPDERGIILGALERAGGNKSLAAKSLGISRTTLWRRMREFDIEWPKYPGSMQAETSETP